MAIRGVNLSETEEFIHPSDPGNPEHKDYKKAVKNGDTPEEPTIYKLGNLTQSDRVLIGDMTNTPSMRDGEMLMNNRNTKRMYEIVRRGLKGWVNQLDHAGKEVAFKETTIQDSDGNFRAVVSDESMSVLPRDMIFDLGTAISDKNGMSSELAKKLSGASRQLEEQLSASGDAPTVPTKTNENEDAQPQPSFVSERSQSTTEPKVSTGD